jgi:hypothetical protein
MNAAILYRLAAVTLLGIVAGQQLLAKQRSPAVKAYHENIKQSATQVPNLIGPWVGVDVPVIARAVKLLAPNILISRKYTNVENGQLTGILIVHCPDAHDMVGHYPPRCYPAEGWDLQSARPITWTLGTQTYDAIEYSFTLPPANPDEPVHTIVIENFLMRPGAVLKDMESLSRAIMGAQGQAAGAGQMQVYFYDTKLTEAQRAAIFHELVQGYRPVIEAILKEIPTKE